MHADDWPIFISHGYNTEMLALIVGIDKIELTFSVFAYFIDNQLSLVDWNFRGDWFSDGTNDEHLIFSAFHDFCLSDKVFFAEDVNIIVS